MGLAWLGYLDRENGGASSNRAPDRILKEAFSLKRVFCVSFFLKKLFGAQNPGVTIEFRLPLKRSKILLFLRILAEAWIRGE